MSAWQPIETAPKDGTRILAGRINYPWTFVVYWRPKFNHWATGSSPMDYFDMPTHWMLPPAPPAD